MAEAVLTERPVRPADGLRLVNVPLDRATAFIRLHHSHLPEMNARGLLYAVGVMKGARLVAVATAGTPRGRWSKRIDPHRILGLTRVASDGTVKGAASKLVGRMIDLLPRSGRNGQPGELFVTYSLEGEPGTPYKALAEKGLRPVGIVKPHGGGGQRRGG